MKTIFKLIILAVISIGISSTSALATTCTDNPVNCTTCNWLLDNCDTDGGADFTSADSGTNSDNPCYPYCS